MRGLPLQPVRLSIKSGLTVLVAGALFATAAPFASADTLDDQRDRVRHEIGQLKDQRSNLNSKLASQRGAVSKALSLIHI